MIAAVATAGTGISNRRGHSPTTTAAASRRRRRCCCGVRRRDAPIVAGVTEAREVAQAHGDGVQPVTATTTTCTGTGGRVTATGRTGGCRASGCRSRCRCRGRGGRDQASRAPRATRRRRYCCASASSRPAAAAAGAAAAPSRNAPCGRRRPLVGASRCSSGDCGNRLPLVLLPVRQCMATHGSAASEVAAAGAEVDVLPCAAVRADPRRRHAQLVQHREVDVGVVRASDDGVVGGRGEFARNGLQRAG